MLPRDSDFLLSIVIPIYNEEKNVAVLYEQILDHLATEYRWEIVFVDDGSTDESLRIIQQLHQSDGRVQYLMFSRNFGHQNALKAGLDHCNGDAIICMDGDLQHPPWLIGQMVERWQNGFDIVCTTRIDGPETGLFKRVTSDFFYKFLTRISNIELRSGSADFRLIDRKVLEVLRGFNESDIFIRGVVAWIGFKQTELPYAPAKRGAGKTKYTLRKMIRFALSGLLGFSVFPLRVASLIGLLVSILSFSYGIYAVWVRIFSDDVVSGWASVMAGIYFLGGVQLVCLGICGEYIGKIFIQVKHRPPYIIKENSLQEGTSSVTSSFPAL